MRVSRVFCLLVLVLRCSADLFRQELFPEQLEQQRLQFRQGDIQLRIQQIQKLKQLSSGPRLNELIQEELNLQAESWRIQQEILRLQLDLQRRINGEKVNFIPAVFQPIAPGQSPVQQPLPQQPFPQRPIPQQPVQQQPQQPLPQQPFPQQPIPQQPVQQQPQQPVQQQPQQPLPQQPVPQEPFFPQPIQPEPVPQEIDNSNFNNNLLENSGCRLESGVSGECKPLVKCLRFYADVVELRKQPCSLGSNGLQGVCCPINTTIPTGGPSKSGILKSPAPPPVPVPPLTHENLNSAAEVGLHGVKQREQFQDNLLARGIFVRPGTAAKWHQDFFPTTNETLSVGDQAQKSIIASRTLVDEFTLSPDQGKFALPKFSLLNTVLADTCPRFFQCFFHKYRSFDGSCNNLKNPHWGQAGTALQRILPPNYADGVNSPRSGRFGSLPSSRLVSTFFATDKEASSTNYSMMVMQWGQFLDHDLTHTPISRGSGGSGISCCRDGQVIPKEFQHPDCFPIELPRNDKVFAPFGERCMEFARSLPAPRPECNFGPREQMNQISGYLDGSNVYGSNVDTANSLRLGRGGFLRAQNVRGRAYLPANPGECTDSTNTFSCFQAGDGRVNEQVDLALMHTIWLREHNRIASVLQRFHPDWSDEALYQEARRIVVAEIQHITYNEYLPILLGPDYMQRSELVPKDDGWTLLYDQDLNGGITNSFATAAFRFGHSQIQSFLHGYGKFGNLRENMELSKQHFAPFVLYKEGAVDDFIRGLAGQPAQNVDRHFSNQITDHLFQGNLDIGLDLFALNLQRGRDHGLAPYNDWREVCGLKLATSWEHLEEHMEPSTILVLSRLYESIDDIDLYTGGIAENPVAGAALGPTFQCLIGDQFARLKRGDRFFYEEGRQPSSFTSQQLAEIRKATLARVLCDNSDDIVRFQQWAFLQPSFVNQRLHCNSDAIPFVDLRAWLDERPAVP